MDKKSSRINALKLRKELNTNIASRNILEAIIKSNILADKTNIGIYYPLENEIDVLGLLDVYKDKNFYLPITKDEIAFVLYKKGDALVDGLFKTKEPKGTTINKKDIDAFIIPCVAISKDNRRLGYGKGYYDKYLSNYNGIKIGVCYKELTNLDIETEMHDIKLDYIFMG